MCKEVVKVSAQSKQEWKLNRRLFQKAAKPLLKLTKWILHTDGRLPYFPWYINCFIQLFVWTLRLIGRKIGLVIGHQGPWAEWSATMKSSAWNRAIHDYKDGLKPIESAFKKKDALAIFQEKKLNQTQLINLLQVLYMLHHNKPL